MGRPTKLTPELSTRIVNVVSGGLALGTAAETQGVAAATAQEWRARGEGTHQRKPTKLYAEFAEAVARAEATFVGHAVATIVKAGEHDWRALIAVLERRYPREWGPAQHRMELTGAEGRPLIGDSDRAALAAIVADPEARAAVERAGLDHLAGDARPNGGRPQPTANGG